MRHIADSSTGSGKHLGTVPGKVKCQTDLETRRGSLVRGPQRPRSRTVHGSLNTGGHIHSDTLHGLREKGARGVSPLRRELFVTLSAIWRPPGHRRIFERNSDAMNPEARCRADRPCLEGSKSRNRLSELLAWPVFPCWVSGQYTGRRPPWPQSSSREPAPASASPWRSPSGAPATRCLRRCAVQVGR